MLSRMLSFPCVFRHLAASVLPQAVLQLRWGVVQPVGHLTVNEDGEGSNPSAPAKIPIKIAAKSMSDGLIPILIPIPSAKKPMFPNGAVSTEGRHRRESQSKSLAVQAVHCWRKAPIRSNCEKGAEWGPKIETTGTPGSYYLRYLKNGRRTFESVGDDLQLALQEQKARHASLDAPTPLTIISARKTLKAEMQTFLANRPESWRHILAVFGDWYGWDNDITSFQRDDFKSYAAHLEKFCPANRKYWSPRTRKNYLLPQRHRAALRRRR